jgi:hypothetical protein
MKITLSSVGSRTAVYWRVRAEESRETARRMAETGPRRGMLEIARIYDSLADRADLECAQTSST